MSNKYLVSLKQGIFRPEGDQVLAVYGTLESNGTEATIGGVLTLASEDIYSVLKYEGTVNEEKIWVL